MYKIGTSSSLYFEDQKAILVIRKSYPAIGGLIFISLFGLVFLIPVVKGSFDGNPSAFAVALAIPFVLLLLPVYLMGYSEHIEMDLSARTIHQLRTRIWINHTRSALSWPAGCEFKYSVDYTVSSNSTEALEGFERIWLTACATETNKAHKLISFSEKKTFVDFQKFFNQQFPENKIMEWRD